MDMISGHLLGYQLPLTHRLKSVHRNTSSEGKDDHHSPHLVFMWPY